jgi:hypothetical protein
MLLIIGIALLLVLLLAGIRILKIQVSWGAEQSA